MPRLKVFGNDTVPTEIEYPPRNPLLISSFKVVPLVGKTATRPRLMYVNVASREEISLLGRQYMPLHVHGNSYNNGVLHLTLPRTKIPLGEMLPDLFSKRRIVRIHFRGEYTQNIREMKRNEYFSLLCLSVRLSRRD